MGVGLFGLLANFSVPADFSVSVTVLEKSLKSLVETCRNLCFSLGFPTFKIGFLGKWGQIGENC